MGLPASTVGGAPVLLPSNPLACGKRARWPVVLRGSRVDWAGWRSCLSRGRCRTTLAGREARWFQRLQIAIDRSPVTLCSLLLSVLFPVALHCDNPGASAKGGGLVGINQTRSLSAGARVRDVSGGEPPLNGSLGHTQLESNLSTVQALFLQFYDVLITSHSLGLTGQLRLCNGSRLGDAVISVGGCSSCSDLAAACSARRS